MKEMLSAKSPPEREKNGTRRVLTVSADSNVDIERESYGIML